MEISHRSKAFQKVIDEAENDLRDLMSIPQNYKILFLQGGASSQFSMVPMNLAIGKRLITIFRAPLVKRLMMKR